MAETSAKNSLQLNAHKKLFVDDFVSQMEEIERKFQ